MDDPFEAWLGESLVFFRQRRLDLFDKKGDDLEYQVRQGIEERGQSLQWIADGKSVYTMRSLGEMFSSAPSVPIGFLASQIVNKERPPEEEQFLFDMLGSSQKDFVRNGIRFMGTMQHDIAELLRHDVLLPEQRRAMRIQDEVPLGNDPTLQEVWLDAWWAAYHRAHDDVHPSTEHWLQWYNTAAKHLTSLAPTEKPSGHLWELAYLCYFLTPQDHETVERFLGGVLYSTLLHREGAEARAEEIYPSIDACIPELFIAGNSVPLRPGKGALRATIDTHPYFVFKAVSPDEARNLQAIYEVIKEPRSSYWRVASFKLNRERPEDFRSLVEAVQSDPTLRDHFNLPCVRTSGIAFRFACGEQSFIAMEYAGTTLADEIQGVRNQEQKERLYRRGLDQLGRFHLLVTENTIPVQGEFRIAPNVATSHDQPVLPVADYRELLERKITGTVNHSQKPTRLPRNTLFPLVMAEAEPLIHYLTYQFLGVTVGDADETNFAHDGLIDVSPCWGNTCWDIARFLYGGSYVLKQDIDRARVRDQYIADTIDRMMRMSEWFAAGVDPSRFQEEHFELYDGFSTRDEYMTCVRMMLEGITPPESHLRTREALIAHSLYQAAIDWEYCRSNSAEEMRKTIQAAAILVGMAEVGSLWNQYQAIGEEIPERQWLCRALGARDDSNVLQEEQHRVRTELAYAVRDSCALMSGQGWGALRVYWEGYLQETRAIPADCFGESSLPSSAMIPSLYDDVHRAIQEKSNPFPKREGDRFTKGLALAFKGVTEAFGILQRQASAKEPAR